jgi:uncharacterized protein YecT (DUF1311 family)
MTGRAFVLLLLFAATAASAQSEGYRSEEGAAKLCAREANWKPVPEATPTEVDRKEFAGVSYCAGWIYRLAGDEYDVVKARRCCLVSGTCNRELGMIFANGWGVRRDYDAAMSFLCRAGSEMAPAEQWGMLDHVEKMRLGETTDELQYCDHVTSGHGGLFCQQVEQARQSAAEKVKIEAVKTSLNREAQAKLTPLLEAVAKFGEAEGARTAEDSLGGTIYPSLVVAGTRTVAADFVKALEARVKARAPKTSAASYGAADRRLNVAYRKLKASAACPTCREDGGNAARAVVREAQRTWIAYRDAWAAFYAARWNGAAPAEALEREIKTLLTRERIKVLETSAE